MKYHRVKSVEKRVAEVFDFRFEPSGWLTLTICEDTGEVSIDSDWGRAGHRWNPEHTGVEGQDRMKRFVASASQGYLWDKFGYEHRWLKEQVLDEKKTKEALLKAVEDHRDRDMLVDMIDELDYGLNADFFLERLPRELWEATEEPFYLVETTNSARSRFWHNELIPFVQRYLVDQGYGR